MKILAIDTTTEACSAALHVDGETTEKFEVAPRRHAELILPMIDSLLAEAGQSLTNLDALAFARGPGAFTGVRLCTSVTQGLAYSADLPVIPVSTLAALAQGVIQDCDVILSSIDARMNEIYYGFFEKNNSEIVQPVTDENICSPEELQFIETKTISPVGTGWIKYEDLLKKKFSKNLRPSDCENLPQSSNIIKIAVTEFERKHQLKAADAIPTYLRDKIA